MNREETDMVHRQMEVYKGKRGNLCQDELAYLVVQLKGKKWPNNGRDFGGRLSECNITVQQGRGYGEKERPATILSLPTHSVIYILSSS